MDVILKRSGNRIGLYIDRELATVFECQDLEQVSDWVKLNLKGVKIHIVK